MSKVITAIVIDGFHKNHTMRMPYYPLLRLIRPRRIRVDECCYGDLWVEQEKPDEVEYKECFRSVDGETVLYSTNGKSDDLLNRAGAVHTSQPWTKDVTLYYNFSSPLPIKTDIPTEQTGGTDD